MKEVTARERVLKSVRDAIIEKSENPYPELDLESSVYYSQEESIDIVFAENFLRNGGKFIFCEGIEETVDSIRFFAQQEKWNKIYCVEENIKRILTFAGIPFSCDPKELTIRKVSFTSCDYLTARTGGIVVSSEDSGRRAFNAVETIVIIATTEQIVPDLKTVLKNLKEKYHHNKLPSMISVLHGISEIKDIDGEIIQGFGPKEIYLFLVDPKQN